MAKGIAQIHVRPSRGKMTVTGMGQTNRGQRYIKKDEPLEVKQIGDKKFKEELATAVEKLLA